jgi:REP-associated tyrosine transposase
MCPFKSNFVPSQSLSRWRAAIVERTKAVRSKRGRRIKPKQTQLAFPNAWGGRRAGSGRKLRAERASVPHRLRAPFAFRLPAEVTLRVRAGLPSLRRPQEFVVLRGAFAGGRERTGFRLVHFSVQPNHLHLIAEGDCRTSLARGLQGLAIRMARALNRLWRRSGKVFADRFHDRILRSPREVWFALRYVLCNGRKHGAWTSRSRPDPLSSAAWFNGWSEAVPATAEVAPTASARTWLLRRGWRQHGLLSVGASPIRPDGRERQTNLGH